MQYVGKLNKAVFKTEFGELKSDNVVLTSERKTHIQERHFDDYELFEKHGKAVIENPDIILKDEKNLNTVFLVKKVEATNMNIVVKLSVQAGDKHPENSIMTAYRIRDKNLKKLVNKNKFLYKSEYL